MRQRKILDLTIIVLILFFSFSTSSLGKFSKISATQPVAEWSFNTITDNTVVDGSGHNLTGTLVNAVITNGTSGKGVYFTGNDSYMMVNDSDYLHMSEFTISLWFQPTRFNSYARLIGKGSSTNETFGIYIKQVTPDQYMIYSVYDTIYSSGGGYYKLNNNWNFIALTFSLENSTLYFNNGLGQITYAIYNSLINNSFPLVLGSLVNSNGYGYEDLFNGSIDSVRIYNRVLTSSEIFLLYSSEKPLNQINSSPQNNNTTKTESNTIISHTTKQSQINSIFTYIVNHEFLKYFLLGEGFLLGISSINAFVLVALLVIKYKNAAKTSGNLTFRNYIRKNFNKYRITNHKRQIPENTFKSLEEIINENK